MPFVNGVTIKGWGVFRRSPWHLAGIYASQQEAEAKGNEMGPDYVVALGEGGLGSDDFVVVTSSAA
jgi:hypothetical protein